MHTKPDMHDRSFHIPVSQIKIETISLQGIKNSCGFISMFMENQTFTGSGEHKILFVAILFMTLYMSIHTCI